MKKICFLFLVTVLLPGCEMLAPTASPTPPLIPTGETPSPLPEPTDPTQVIVVSPGQTFDIVLPSNPSTGYSWQLVTPLDANLLQAAGQTYLAQQPVIPGSGGVDLWTFSTLAPGKTTIQLGYYPPANDTQPDETVIFTVQIE